MGDQRSKREQEGSCTKEEKDFVKIGTTADTQSLIK